MLALWDPDDMCYETREPVFICTAKARARLVYRSISGSNSSLVKLDLGGFGCLRILELPALSSSTSVGFTLWHASSIAVIYSRQGSLGLQQSLVHVTGEILEPLLAGAGFINYPSHWGGLELYLFWAAILVWMFVAIFAAILFSLPQPSKFSFWRCITFWCLTFLRSSINFSHSLVRSHITLIVLCVYARLNADSWNHHCSFFYRKG